MARQPRIVIPGIAQHVVQRGVNRAPIFREPSDYWIFLVSLGRACRKYQVDLHAYVLMTNHVHLVMTPRSALALSQALQSIGSRYVPRFNKRYQRTGTLFEGRFKAWMIESERYFLTCMRYIELNPVSAGIVKTPDAYRWSSYSTHGLGASNELLVPHPLYMGLGATARDRQTAWRSLCEHQTPTEADLPPWINEIPIDDTPLPLSSLTA